MPGPAPRVFLSHASEDKQRFVLPFATALRSRGLDVWLDRWEMLPGDSLVDKIFSEGLAGAAAVVVVLSNASVQKRWVTEELDAAVVKRIQDNTKLIPIVLDGLEPIQLPMSIRHLLFEAVPDPSHLDRVVDRVVRSVFGKNDKPPIGSAPSYASSEVPEISGLDRVDALVLKAMGDEAVRDFGDHFNTQEFLNNVDASLGVTDEQAVESLEVLDADGYIEIGRSFGRGVSAMAHFRITTAGIDAYAHAFVEGYDRMQQALVSRLAGWPTEQGTDEELAASADVPRLLALHMLKILSTQGLLGLSEPSGPWAHFYGLSPKLRRMT